MRQMETKRGIQKTQDENGQTQRVRKKAERTDKDGQY